MHEREKIISLRGEKMFELSLTEDRTHSDFPLKKTKLTVQIQ